MKPFPRVRLMLGLASAAASCLLVMDTRDYPEALVGGVVMGVVAVWGVYTGVRDLF